MPVNFTRIPVLPGSVVLDVAGLKVGFIGVMVPMVTDRMATKVASAYIWEQPVPAATKVAKALRSDVDCLIAITHIGLRHDRELAVACPALDLILGGHSHSTLTEPERIGKVMICQGGSHGRFVGRYEWLADRGLISAELVPLA
jgi:2',3'-cyclic-nucleotide 2'-phosphodiesterase (5'-nucleotidase family)